MFAVFSYEKKEKIERYYKQDFEHLSSNYESMFLNYKNIFEVLFFSTVDDNETASILLDVLKNQTDANISRAMLLNKMLPVYSNLKTLGVKQFQFHLPDNASFLRVHEPTLYGDVLTGFRRTVYLVNRDKKPAFAFEIGRFASGFRYVFPIMRGENHLGSVEFGVGYDAIIRAMQNTSGAQYALLVKKDALKKPNILKKELDNFLALTVCDEYLLEGGANKELARLLENAKNNSAGFMQKLLLQKSFYIASKLSDDFYTLGFYSLKDVGGAHIAYLVEYKKDGIYELYSTELVRKFAFSSLFVALILSVVFLVRKRS